MQIGASSGCLRALCQPEGFLLVVVGQCLGDRPQVTASVQQGRAYHPHLPGGEAGDEHND